MITTLKTIDKRPIIWVAIISAFFGLIISVYTYAPVDVEWTRYGPPSFGVDWKGAFRPAVHHLLNGQSPYLEPNFFNPPWILIPLIPVALLSPELGTAVMYAANMFLFLFAAYKLKTHPVLMAFFVFFSGMISASTNGNIEGLLALGFILPPQIGLFFVLAKPQFGLAVAVYWGVQALREGGVRRAVKTFWPVTTAYLLSFLVFGLWILPAQDLTNVWWNSGIFPYGVPVGVALLGLSIWKREIRYAIAASPFFSPYLTSHTWAVVWLGMLSLFEIRRD